MRGYREQDRWMRFLWLVSVTIGWLSIAALGYHLWTLAKMIPSP